MSFFHLSPQKKLLTISLVFFVSWICGTLLIHYFERSQGWSYFDAFYFNVITTATIGFGDLTPKSWEGKIITMIYAIFYVPLFLYSMSLIFEANVRRIYHSQQELENRLKNTGTTIESILSRSEPSSH